MTINEKLSEIRSFFCEGDNKKFAEMLGFSPQYASNICKEGKSVGESQKMHILSVFPNINKSWLFADEGVMLKQPEKNDTKIEYNQSIHYMNVKERLLSYLTHKKIGQNAFERQAGIANGYISKVKGSIGSTIITRIVDAAPDLNRDWLLYGEGEMLKENESKQKNTTETHLINFKAKDYKLVPLYNMDARGGFGANDEVDCTEYIVDLIPFKDAKDKDICVPVSGKSMMPTYCPGTVVLLHEIENWFEFLETGQIYVLILKDGRRLIKELRRSEEDRQTNYLCISHNPDFEPVELPKKLIYRVYLVTAMYQKTSI